MKTTVLAVVALLVLSACGSSGTESSPPDINQAVNGAWTGTTTVTFPGFAPSYYSSELTVAASGTSATISQVCFDGSGAVIASGSGNSVTWSGALVCAPVTMGTCSSVTITFNSISGVLSANGTTLTGQGSGTATGCSSSSSVTFSFVGTK